MRRGVARFDIDNCAAGWAGDGCLAGADDAGACDVETIGPRRVECPSAAVMHAGEAVVRHGDAQARTRRGKAPALAWFLLNCDKGLHLS